MSAQRWHDLGPYEQIMRRQGYREDVEILFGRSASVTGIPGPHARARQAAVSAERRLAEAIAAHENGKS